MAHLGFAIRRAAGAGGNVAGGWCRRAGRGHLLGRHALGNGEGRGDEVTEDVVDGIWMQLLKTARMFVFILFLLISVHARIGMRWVLRMQK